MPDAESVPNARAPSDGQGTMSRTRLTPELQHLVASYVGAGASIKVACQAAGIPWSTASDWLRKGKQEVEPYATFVAVMTESKARYRAAMEAVITSAAKRGDWRAAAYAIDKRSAAQRERDARPRIDPLAEKTVLVYPVALPEGADLSEHMLPSGHAIDTTGETVAQHQTEVAYDPIDEEIDP